MWSFKQVIQIGLCFLTQVESFRAAVSSGVLRGTTNTESVSSTNFSKYIEASAVSTALPLISTLLFVLSLRALNSHETSKRGNFLGILGAATSMTAIFITHWSSYGPERLVWFLAVAAFASFWGIIMAASVKMEEMPELVAGFHSLTGLAAVLVGFSSFFGATEVSLGHNIETFVGISVGAATFTGSVVAAGKLHGLIPGRPIGVAERNVVLPFSVVMLLILGGMYTQSVIFKARLLSLAGNLVASGVVGIIGVLPIGGADMPVVVSLLNSLSGIATSASGFMLQNNLLVMTGALVASSGALLSNVMCKGINRSLLNVLLGGFGVTEGVILPTGDGEAQEVKEVTAIQLAQQMRRMKKVLVVPGYGMAVARCQSVIAEIARLCRSQGISVMFGIHPVAGRLPGHMNVLLAEANVPYDIVHELEEINHDIESFDLAIVLGANDIVNPATQTDPQSPIFGMPAIEVWKAKACVVLKRSMATGYSGVENPLFFHENTRMLFGDAKKSLDDIQREIASFTDITAGAKVDASDASNSDDVAVAVDVSELPVPSKYVGVISETVSGEKRLAVSPRVVIKLRKLGFGVFIESGAGASAQWKDSDFIGADILPSSLDVLKRADILLKINPIQASEATSAEEPEGAYKTIISGSIPSDIIPLLVKTRAAAFNLSLVPRISRAQKLDILTSMANIAGYRAVIEAFHLLPKFSRTSVTACGKLPAATVFIIGAGVAGLSAIATAKALGCHVIANDVRAATKDQVESMGAKFIEILDENGNPPITGEGAGGYAKELSQKFASAQLATYAKAIRKSDVVICTAMIPGRPAPKLITRAMVATMAPGSVIVDLAAPGGGNCELTVTEETIVDSATNVTVIGRTNFTSDMPQQSSDLLGHNFLAFLELLGGGSKFTAKTEDPIVRQCLVTIDGQVAYPPTPITAPVTAEVKRTAPTATVDHQPPSDGAVIDFLRSNGEELSVLIALGTVLALGLTSDATQVRLMGDFILSLLIGNFTVASVAPALHTPLISVTNAISGIIVVGGIIQMQGQIESAKVICALVAVFFSMINVSGGFAVSQRMLQMFKAGGNKIN